MSQWIEFIPRLANENKPNFDCTFRSVLIPLPYLYNTITGIESKAITMNKVGMSSICPLKMLRPSPNLKNGSDLPPI